MADLEWLYGALVGAAVSAIGFGLNKWVIEPQKKRREDAQKWIRSLTELNSLLSISRDTFVNQNAKARRLLTMLERSHADILGKNAEGEPIGFDDVFHRCFDSMNQEERELFSLIRGTTTHTMRETNNRLTEWLKDNMTDNATFIKKEGRDLEGMLDTLRRHLDAWFDKYAVWIPDDQTRSLVYLDDEKRHGPGFPSGIDSLVRSLLDSKQPAD